MRPDYVPLSSHVVEAFEKTARVPPNLAMREAAAYLASVTWGIEKVQALTVLLNVAGLAVASGDTVPLYTLGQGVVRRVAEALETMVTVEAPPSMMKEPWIIEPFGYERGALPHVDEEPPHRRGPRHAPHGVRDAGRHLVVRRGTRWCSTDEPAAAARSRATTPEGAVALRARAARPRPSWRPGSTARPERGRTRRAR